MVKDEGVFLRADGRLPILPEGIGLGRAVNMRRRPWTVDRYEKTQQIDDSIALARGGVVAGGSIYGIATQGAVTVFIVALAVGLLFACTGSLMWRLSFRASQRTTPGEDVNTGSARSVAAERQSSRGTS